MKNHITSKILKLYQNYAAAEADSIAALPISGSVRQYYRLTKDNQTIIVCYNDNFKENKAFIEYSRHFASLGLAVPKILAVFLEEHIYFQEDLGDTTLFDLVVKEKKEGSFSDSLISIYKRVIEQLLAFQIKGKEGIDYSIAYPRPKFDKQSMLWDLNYFKHYFIKLAGVSFDEQELEDDFHSLSSYLMECKNSGFLYRDFQSRNIMIKDDKLFFIDYQGGREGSLQYDLASLLWDAKADIPHRVRQQLLDYYLEKLNGYITYDKDEFVSYYYAFVLIRIMQAFGAYGYRGFFERKQHFLLSIPFALNNLKWIINNIELKVNIPALQKVFLQMINSPGLTEFDYQPRAGLSVQIRSFSYKRSIPLDNSGNGGGFVFDCRFLPNPGREEAYKELTGNDEEVIQYLRSKKEVGIFLQHVKAISDQAVGNYLQRQFTNLMLSFGCTGGRHRSVYCANQLYYYLKENYKDVYFEIKHIEQEIELKEGKR